jgi:hypothetical protein
MSVPNSGHEWGCDKGRAPISHSLNQLQPLQARMPFLADDDVVMHGNAERLRHRNDLLRHLDVGARWRRIAGRVIVQHAV